jgi:hypothetical protein
LDYIKFGNNNMSNKKIYIAGPMTGHPNNNWDAFFQKEKDLQSEGWITVNPARMDKELGLEPGVMGAYSYEECASRDIVALYQCNAIYMLANWQTSKGACWERALAKFWNITRYYEIPRASHEEHVLDIRGNIQQVDQKKKIAQGILELLESEQFMRLMAGSNHPEVQLDELRAAYKSWMDAGGRNIFEKF